MSAVLAKVAAHYIQHLAGMCVVMQSQWPVLYFWAKHDMHHITSHRKSCCPLTAFHVLHASDLVLRHRTPRLSCMDLQNANSDL